MNQETEKKRKTRRRHSMANMITTVWKIKGEVGILKSFLNGLFVDGLAWNRSSGVQPSFSSYVPFPEGLEGDDDWAYEYWGTPTDLNSDDGYEIEEVLKQFNRKRKETTLVECQFQKETVYRAPIPWFLTVSEQFPTLTFQLTFNDEGDWVVKQMDVQNGEILRDEQVDSRIEAWKFNLMIHPDHTQEEMLELFWDDLLNEVSQYPTREEMFAHAPIYFEELYTEERIHAYRDNDYRISKEMLDRYYDCRH